MADLQPIDQPCCPRNKRSWVFWAIVFVAGLLLINTIGVLMPVLQSMRGGPETHAGVGSCLTFLEVRPLTGGPPPLSTSDLQGHVTLINLWGAWCPPCREELPHMAGLRQRFTGQEAFRLVAISYPRGGQGGDTETLRDETTVLLKRLNLDLPTYHDPDGKTLAAADQVIGFQGFPTTLLLDRGGVIRAVWVGYRPGTEGEIERHVNDLLGEKG